MKVLAGTTDGIYAVEEGDVHRLLECRCVREMVRLDGRLFAGTDAGLFCSDGEGESWTPAGLADREVWQIRGAGGRVVYASTQPAGLFRSDDAGATWVEVESFARAPEAADWCLPVTPPEAARARALVIERDDPRRIRVGVEVGGVMRTDDAGETWRHGLPGENPDLHMMFAHPERSNVLFASTGYGRPDGEAERVEGNAGVFRSRDFGASWSYVWRGVTPRYSRPMCVDHRAPHGLTVGSAPSARSSCKDEQGGAQAMLFRSENEGETWRSLCDPAHSPSQANFHGLAPDPERPGGVVVGTDTGEVWRVNDDAEWTMLGSGMPLVASILPL